MSDKEIVETPEIEPFYAVYAEAQGHSKPLMLLELTFARLIDDIIVPYQTGEPFYRWRAINNGKNNKNKST